MVINTKPSKIKNKMKMIKSDPLYGLFVTELPNFFRISVLEFRTETSILDII